MCVKGRGDLFPGPLPALHALGESQGQEAEHSSHGGKWRHWVSLPRHHEKGKDYFILHIRSKQPCPVSVGYVHLAICLERKTQEPRGTRGAVRGSQCPPATDLSGACQGAHITFFQLSQEAPLEKDPVGTGRSQV